ncbi:putative leader peptide [Streptomyces sp. NPDC052301]
MVRLETAPGRAVRKPASAPLLTSRRHIDLLRVCSAIGMPHGAPSPGR